MPRPRPRAFARRLVALVGGVVLIVGACSSDESPTPDDAASTTIESPEVAPPDEPGPFAVGHVTTATIDPDRDRVLPLTIWYPASSSDEDDAPLATYPYVDGIEVVSERAVTDAPIADGRFPLVVFSHGFGGTSTQSSFLVEALASHGFVVAAPDHLGNTAFDIAAGTDVDQAVSAADRPADVSLVIDDLLARNDNPEDPLHGHVDAEHVGVTGHSFGGFTTLAVAVETAGTPFEPRVDAVAAIAPASPLSDEALASITLPTLLLGGTLDTNTPIDPNVTRPWELIGSDVLYRVDVIDAGHLSFATPCDQRDAAEASPDPISPLTQLVLDVSAPDSCGPDRVDVDEAHRLTNRYVVAFFQVHVAGETGYETYLTPTSGVTFAP